MKTARWVIFTGLLVSAAVWILLKEPNSSAFRAELIARSQNEGLALASFYSIPGSLTVFEQDQPVYLRTDRFGFATVSPDGEHLFVNGSASLAQLSDFSGLEDLNGRHILAVPHELVSSGYRYNVAPDLHHVAVWSPRGPVRLIELSGDNLRETEIADDMLRRADFLTWSPTGSQIVFEYDQEIFVYSLANGVSHRIATGLRPAWSPDGSWIAFRSIESDAMLMKPGEDHARRIIAGRVANGFSWSPDSQYLLFGRKYRFQIPLGPLGYMGAYRLRDGARSKIEECSFKGMCTPEEFSWVTNYSRILQRFQPK